MYSGTPPCEYLLNGDISFNLDTMHGPMQIIYKMYVHVCAKKIPYTAGKLGGQLNLAKFLPCACTYMYADIVPKFTSANVGLTRHLVANRQLLICKYSLSVTWKIITLP